MQGSSLQHFRKALGCDGTPWACALPDQLTHHIYASFDEVPEADWLRWAGRDVFLSPAYLRVMERSAGVYRVFYLMFSEAGSVTGIAVVQQVGFSSRRVEANLESRNAMVRYLTKKLTPANASTGSILLCGNAYATGEHAFSFSPNVHPQRAMEGLCAAISTIASQLRDEVAAIVVKDFFAGSSGFDGALGKSGFASFRVDHNMIMPVLPHWKHFDDYLADLNTKFRTKALAALRRSQQLDVHDFEVAEMEAHRERLAALFEQVLAKADFKMGKLTFEDLIALKASLGPELIFRVYLLGDQPVGFLAAFRSGVVLDAHVVGIDYAKNRNLAIYPRMLYDYIALAIELGADQIWFGRTAGEIKTTIGALPVEMRCCIRHTRKVSNFLLRILFNYVKPSEFPIRRPYHREIGLEVARRVGQFTQ